MAKIVRFHELGGPEVFRVEDVDLGEPGSDEVLIDIDAIGLNRGEAAFRGYNFLELLKDKTRFAATMEGIASRVRDGRFQMPVAKVFKLDDAVEAHRYLESNTHVGKIVMQP